MMRPPAARPMSWQQQRQRDIIIASRIFLLRSFPPGTRLAVFSHDATRPAVSSPRIETKKKHPRDDAAELEVGAVQRGYGKRVKNECSPSGSGGEGAGSGTRHLDGDSQEEERSENKHGSSHDNHRVAINNR